MMKDSLNYQQTLAQVELIITEIESGSLDLTELFRKLKLALDYLKHGEKLLAESEQEIQLFIETLTDELTGNSRDS